jgi:hypothetical protein
MKKLFAIALFFFACQSVSTLAQEPARRFPITFETDGKKVQTSLTLRIKHGGKLTEIKYIPTEPLAFPEFRPDDRFDLWIVTDKYVFPFLDMHSDALKVSGWRIGIDHRPFHLDYLEVKLLKPDVKLVYYMIYQLADGAETPIWFESDKPLDAFRK